MNGGWAKLRAFSDWPFHLNRQSFNSIMKKLSGQPFLLHLSKQGNSSQGTEFRSGTGKLGPRGPLSTAKPLYLSFETWTKQDEIVQSWSCTCLTLAKYATSTFWAFKMSNFSLHCCFLQWRELTSSSRMRWTQIRSESQYITWWQLQTSCKEGRIWRFIWNCHCVLEQNISPTLACMNLSGCLVAVKGAV